MHDPAKPGPDPRRRWFIWIGGGLLLAGLLSLSPVFLFGLAFVLGSERTVYERSPSPSGWREARVQFDDAGALSEFERVVFIKDRWNPSDAPLLSCRAFEADGEGAVHLKWLDDRTLLIRHAFPAGDVRAVASRCGPIRIITGELAKSP